MIREEKQILRLQMRAALKAFPEKAAASGKIRAFLRDAEVWKSARVIYGFLPMASEPDWLGGDGLPDKVLAYPRVTETGLAFVTGREFRPGPHGASEPAGEEIAPPPDLVLVPGLAFDRQGSRLGRGGGYYDRFLETLEKPRPVLCGIGFACQVVPMIPREPHDACVEMVLTEAGW